MADTTGTPHKAAGRDKEITSSVHAAKILIVDDMVLMQRMIGLCLNRGGFENLLYASDGDQALKMIEEFMPDLVVLDLNMPTVSGYEVCRTLRADPKYNSLPILVQSASEAPEERVEVFNSGATDFVSKPINQPELLARVRMHLENKFLIHSLSDFRARIENELVLAREMQRSLLPEKASLIEIEKETRTIVESYYKASFELGGDLWGGWLLPNNQLGFYVLDISGHGVAAALNTFRVHASMARFKDTMTDPALFLTELNKAMKASFQLGQFGTMFYAVLNYETGTLTYAGAGAPRPMIISGTNVRLLDSSGIPVGVLKEPKYENHNDRLEVGESIFCYSDVLIEAPMAGGAILGEDGLIDWVKELVKSKGRTQLTANLLARFFDTQPEALPDDLTAVAIHRRSGIEEGNA
ncbi:PP2C family protein-serine/threonine phosphatase [Kordiimonas pumila]|uniref:PP2C family protein-serine/threonine phosphatase n=1 Tax=Kordiimonas pumila TaxID=2161677 RepID=A0ABV7D0Z7_9PROT|nr:fused response regulator/phosphatase [Kordiimonas pumila]